MEKLSSTGHLTNHGHFLLASVLAVDTVMLCDSHYKTSVADYNKQLLLTYFRSNQFG